MTEFGNPLEAFVIGALRKHAAWLDEPGTVGHWRTHDGDEVDRVMESDDGRVPAFEVKATERVTTRDLEGLRPVHGALEDRFVAGVALTSGPAPAATTTKSTSCRWTGCGDPYHDPAVPDLANHVARGLPRAVSLACQSLTRDTDNLAATTPRYAEGREEGGGRHAQPCTTRVERAGRRNAGHRWPDGFPAGC